MSAMYMYMYLEIHSVAARCNSLVNQAIMCDSVLIIASDSNKKIFEIFVLTGLIWA